MDGAHELVQVQLLGLSLRARSGFEQHLQDLTRELSLVRIGAGRGPGPALSPRLLEVATELGTTYAAFRVEPDAAVEAALAAGRRTCDVTYTVPASAVPFLRRLGEVLAEADEFSRGEQHLLVLPATPEVVAYRDWIVSEAARQAAGEPPTPWRPLPEVPEDPGGSRVPASRAAAGGLPPELRADTVRERSGRAARAPLEMASMAGNVASARRYVREVLRELGRPELEESAELGVSELVTNAVLHARTAFTVAVRTADDGTVRVEVSDSSPLAIHARHSAPTSTTGRGLQLVASVSSGWGVEDLSPALGPGKTAWFAPRADVQDAGSSGPDWAAELEGLL